MAATTPVPVKPESDANASTSRAGWQAEAISQATPDVATNEIINAMIALLIIKIHSIYLEI
ncbi:hypothetical protein GCM10028809_51750 [Spirosoma gilvum]